eukprot:3247026-Rhodomonas_salina.1
MTPTDVNGRRYFHLAPFGRPGTLEGTRVLTQLRPRCDVHHDGYSSSGEQNTFDNGDLGSLGIKPLRVTADL